MEQSPHEHLYLNQTCTMFDSYGASQLQKCYDAKKFTDERGSHET